MSRYIIIGAGAVGATVAAQLTKAGFPVVVVARGANLDALRANGLTYIRPDGIHRVPLEVVGGPDEISLQSDDVLVLATKSQDTESILQQWSWQPVRSDAGGTSAAERLPLVVLQNGLENVRPALRRFALVIDAVVMIASSHVKPGETIAPSAPIVGAFYLGRAPFGEHDAAHAVAGDLRQAGFAVQVVTDIERWKAGKLLGNIAYNLDSLYGASPLREQAAAAVRDEAREVLLAAGIEVADIQGEGSLDLSGLVTHTIEGYERRGSSTWQSVARGASAELDFLSGEIALQARLIGREAPLNAAVQARLARLIRDGDAPGSLGDADLRELLDRARPARADVLIDVAELSSALASARPPALLDVRWALGDPRGYQNYLEAHIPGAVFVDLETELAAPAEPQLGRHPLPTIAALQEAAQRWGISAGQPVVVYDNVGGLSAARAWWLLRWAGVRDVRILNGTLAAWIAAGQPLESGETKVAAGDITLSSGHLPVLSAEEAADFATSGGVLLDARAGERYRGEVEPVDPRAGHIPGAVSAPTADNLDGAGRFAPADSLRTRFADLGLEPGARVGVYCGSGVTAAHEVAALAIAGIDAALYPGSWSAWSSDPDRPAATGPHPNGAAQ
jgi:thiosulfate/3-mercaptopyruvate sulfurtransferase